MEILRHRRSKLNLFSKSQFSVDEAAEMCVDLTIEEDPRYDGPNRNKRVEFWRNAIAANRSETVTFIPESEGKADGLCDICDHPDKPSCLGKKMP